MHIYQKHNKVAIFIQYFFKFLLQFCMKTAFFIENGFIMIYNIISQKLFWLV